MELKNMLKYVMEYGHIEIEWRIVTRSIGID